MKKKVVLYRYQITFYRKPRQLHMAQRYVVKAPNAIIAKTMFKRKWAGGRGIGKKHDLKDYTITKVKRGTGYTTD